MLRCQATAGISLSEHMAHLIAAFLYVCLLFLHSPWPELGQSLGCAGHSTLHQKNMVEEKSKQIPDVNLGPS